MYYNESDLTYLELLRAQYEVDQPENVEAEPDLSNEDREALYWELMDCE